MFLCLRHNVRDAAIIASFTFSILQTILTITELDSPYPLSLIYVVLVLSCFTSTPFEKFFSLAGLQRIGARATEYPTKESTFSI